jgi:hypothetical protein
MRIVCPIDLNLYKCNLTSVPGKVDEGSVVSQSHTRCSSKYIQLTWLFTGEVTAPVKGEVRARGQEMCFVSSWVLASFVSFPLHSGPLLWNPFIPSCIHDCKCVVYVHKVIHT